MKEASIQATDKFSLTNQAIETAVETLSDFLRSYQIEQKEILRTTLTLEDALLNYQENFGEKAVCSLKCIRRVGRIRIEIVITGESYNPYAREDEENFSGILLSRIGMIPVWSYRNGQNIIILTPKKKQPSQMVYIAAAVGMALSLGMLSKLLPQSVQDLICSGILVPVFDTFLGLLNAVAGMMIFFSVVWGICGIGDMATLSNLGKKMIGRMLFMMTFLPTVFALCILPLFQFRYGSAQETVDLSGPFSMILGIIPDNMITPFTEGNFLQIIFIAAMVGVALLVLGNKTSLVVAFIEQSNSVVQLIMEVICSAIFVVIFVSLYSMVINGSFSILLKAYKAPVFILIGCLFAIMVYLCIICITTKVKPNVFINKVMPSFLIGLTTASSSAAMTTTMETCEKQLGIDKKIVNFGIPLGQILFGTNSVTEFIVIAFCMAEIYSVPVTPVWIVMAIFTSVILTVATPPIPGGSVALCTILFTQLGLPLDGIAVAVAIDVIADFFITAAEIFCLQGELVITSGKLDMLDRERLCKAKLDKPGHLKKGGIQQLGRKNDN